MSLIDAKGRLFGKVSLLDLGAGLIILMAVVGIFVLPGGSGKSLVAQVQTQPLEITAIVRGLNALDINVIVQDLKSQKTDIIIRNQPAGQVTTTNVQILPRNLAVPQPDGGVKALPDPRPEAIYSNDLLLTLSSQGDMTPTGVVVGGQKLKVGTVLELEGKSYNFNASVINLKTQS